MENYIISDIKINNFKKQRKGTAEIKFIDRTYLDSFKEYLKNEIDNFSPNKNNSEIHLLIKSIWHHYIFNNVPDDKYYDFLKKLNGNLGDNIS